MKENKIGNQELSLFQKLACHWTPFLHCLLQPLVIFPTAVIVLSLYFANGANANKSFSLILQIIAALLASLVGGIITNFISKYLKEDILTKKGKSAVRNLALTRSKLKDMEVRIQNKAGEAELYNLLSWLGKELSNAIQEWNDILPGIEKLEENYILLQEREEELIKEKQEREELKKQYEKAQHEGDEAKKKFRILLEEKDERIKSLEERLQPLRFETNPFVASGTVVGATDYLPGSFNVYSAGLRYIECRKCHKIFGRALSTLVLGEQDVCDECKGK